MTTPTLPSLTIEQADALARECEYAWLACHTDENPINYADAGAFFLEGYNHARKVMGNATVDVSAKYNELLYAVARKFPGESRHETALRYIREREQRAGEAGSCTSNAPLQVLERSDNNLKAEVRQ